MAATILEDNARPGLSRLAPAVLALLLFAVVFVGLRWIHPAWPPYVPNKHPPGVPLLLYTVTVMYLRPTREDAWASAVPQFGPPAWLAHSEQFAVSFLHTN